MAEEDDPSYLINKGSLSSRSIKIKGNFPGRPQTDGGPYLKR